MKRLIVTTACVIGTLMGQAQTLDEAIGLYKYNRLESAKNILTPMASSNALANYYLGLVELENENTDLAKSIFEKYPEDAANQAGLARVMLAQNKTPEAMSMLSKVAAKAKKKDYMPLRYAADAITYSQGGELNMAVEWYKKAMETERTPDLHIGLGDAYKRIQGGGGDAMTNYEYAETFPKYASLANYKKGYLWYVAKNYDSALACYGRASTLDDKNPLPYKALADAYYKIGKFKLSKEKIEKYLELSDKTLDDQIQYANTLYLAKEYPSAITKMNELIAKGAEKPYMYRIIAFSLLETKDYMGAISNMDKFFAKQDPKKVLAIDHINYGKMLLKDSTKANLANASFIKGVDADTAADKIPTYRGIAENFYEADQFANSGEWYKKIVQSGSASIESTDYWWAGVMYFYAKDYANAEPMFKLYNEKYPTEPISVFWMGRITESSKDKDFKTGAAAEYYTRWMSMINEDPAKKKDLIKAYTYLAMVAYNKNDKTNATLYSDKILALDATNSVGNQIKKNIPNMK